MKISSWNVNSVRARIINILNYLKTSSPDILMIQEIKTEEKNFPFNDFKNLGYYSYVFGQKNYNGVAFLSKENIDKISVNFIKDEKNQSRIITGNIKNKSKVIKLINVYVPNGNPIGTEKYEYKKNHFLRFDEEKGNKLKSMRFVPGCALLFNLKELSKIGFYDENFFLFFEENDIYMRCLKKDHKIFMLTDAIISDLSIDIY